MLTSCLAPCLSLSLPVLCTGCSDGVVGVAARVASVQMPWLSLEEEPSPDLTNHIAGLEAMLCDMQLKVRQRQNARRFKTDTPPSQDTHFKSDLFKIKYAKLTTVLRPTFDLSVLRRCASLSGQWKQSSRHGSKLRVTATTLTTIWRT